MGMYLSVLMNFPFCLKTLIHIKNREMFLAHPVLLNNISFTKPRKRTAKPFSLVLVMHIMTQKVTVYERKVPNLP
jgi:hypothetical protein